MLRGDRNGYEKLKIDEIEEDALIECFTKPKRKSARKRRCGSADRMKWNEKNRALEPATAKAGALQIACEGTSRFRI